MDVTDFIGKFVPTLERYCMATEKESFIDQLDEGYDKTILKLMTNSYSLNLKKKMIQAGIPQKLASTLEENKVLKKIFEAKSKTEVVRQIQIVKKKQGLSFHHSRPMQVSSQNKMEKGELKELNLPSKLTTDDSLATFLLRKLSETEENIQLISNYGLKMIPQYALKKLSLNHREFILRKPQVVRSLDIDFITDFIIDVLKEKRKKNPTQKLPYSLVNCLTIEQINLLAQKEVQLFNYPNFTQKYFRLNYEDHFPLLKAENKDLSFEEKREKRRVLMQIKKKFQEQKFISWEDFLYQVNTELLMIDLALEDPDLQRYITYLQQLRSPIPLLKRQHSKLRSSQSFTMHYSELPSADISIQTLCDDYLKALLKKYDYEKLDRELPKRIIDEFYYYKERAKIMLSKGESLGNMENELTEEEKRKIAEVKFIKITDKNKNKFMVNEDVALNVKVKNIKQIKVKIYELNLEKHYLEESKEIQDTINLSYLEPTYTTIYQTELSNKYEEKIYDIKIEKIKKERGIYVVDLEGDSISSRAVIRKGCIYCFKKMILAGTQLKFYDEDGTKLENLDLWVRGQKIKVNNSYTLPFVEEKESIKVVAMVGSYAELFDVKVPAEKYDFKVFCLYNHETFIVGNKAKIILHPRLQLSNSENQYQQVSLKLLNNIRIRVLIQNSLGIKSSLNFENVVWSSKEDYVLEFPVQSYIKNVNIFVEADIKKLTGAVKTLTFEKNIQIQLREKNPIFIDYYLNKVNDKYVIDIVGKNGEPVPNFDVTVSYLQNTFREIQKKNLRSDSEGKIHLGPMKLVNSLAIAGNSDNSNSLKTWQISNPKLEVTLINEMSFKEGEIAYIPIPRQKLNLQTDIIIHRKKKSSYLENCTKNASIQDNYLVIKNLTEGVYEVNFFPYQHQVRLKIVKGVQWKDENQVYNKKEEIIYEFERINNQYLCLGSAQVREEQNSNKVTVQITKPAGYSIENMRAHVLASNFILQTRNELPYENDLLDLKVNKFRPKYNSYFSDKTLSQEESYVLNRKNQKQFIGNSMEKPHIFLNRIKVRDTQQKEEVLEQGKAYNIKQQKKRMRNSSSDEDSELMEENFVIIPEKAGSKNFPFSSNKINPHNNFLAYGGFSIGNIKEDTIQFQLPKNYSNFTIVLVANNSCIEKKYSVHGNVAKKQVDHLGIKGSDQKLAWTMSREVYQIQKGEKMKINRDSKWCAVSLQNVVNFAKLKTVSLEDWVLNWNSYSQEKKLETYNKKVCHQLNSYIKHHDVKFFDQVVKPYISNKIEKTFVDLCLLEKKQCLQWTENHLIGQLNEFEKILLVEELMRRKKLKLASRIATAMVLTEKTKKQAYKNFKKQFETVLNAKQFEQAVEEKNDQDDEKQMRRDMRMQLEKQRMYMKSRSKGGMREEKQMYKRMMMNEPYFERRMMMMDYDDDFDSPRQSKSEKKMLQMRNNYTQPFKAVEKTQEFTEVTYSDVKDKKTANLIAPAQFWADLADHITNNPNKEFVSENFMYLKDKISFTTAACFLPSQPIADFEIQSSGQNFVISAKSTFLIFVKEIKEVDYQAKFGIMINHRFFDPFDQFHYEDNGLKVEKEVEEFVIHRQYSIQTVVTNTSGTNLEIQLLIDIPQGAIPLMTHEYTQIINTTIPAFSTQSFQRFFYFPKDGEYSFYPSNACWDKTVIAKANEQQKLVVKNQATKKNLKSFTDVIRSGTEKEIITFLREKNIFDKNMFVPAHILWMLKEKKIFQVIIELMRDRGYYNNEIWQYGFLHEDIKTIQEYLQFAQSKNPVESPFKIFEYYPYYSTRSHKFLNESKTTIRNVEFKQTYFRFLFDSVVAETQGSAFKLAFTYYLLLQDRIDEAAKCFKTISQEERGNYRLQADYFDCFLNMYEDFPNFTIARKVSAKYLDYPVTAWRNLFKEIADTLKEYNSTTIIEDETAKVEYKTAVFNEGDTIRINVPPKTKVEVLLFPINLELYFSDVPFGEVKSFSAIKPDRSIVYVAGESREEKLKRQENMKDLIVEVYSTSEGLPSRKVSSFLWSNPKVKVKVNESRGNLQLFHEGKQVSGAYCKVYSSGVKGERFYRDGYTDITGTFKFALTDLKQVKQFSILTMTDHGGVLSRVKPPSQAGYIKNQ